MRQTFRAPELQERFEADGFVFFDLFGADEVAAVRARVEEIYVGERENTAHSSVESPHLEYRSQMHDLLCEVLGPAVERVFLDHRAFNSATIIKWTGPDSVMPPHQDWTAVDESSYRSVNMWVPLVDTTPENGAMSLLRGSHRVLTRMRTSPIKPSWFEDCAQRIDPNAIETFPMAAGSCLVLDNALLHYSRPNLTDDPRIALVHGLAPAEADLFHYSVGDDDVVARYRVRDRAFFLEFRPGMIPSGEYVVKEGPVPYGLDVPGAAEWVAAATPLLPAPVGAEPESEPAPAEPPAVDLDPFDPTNPASDGADHRELVAVGAPGPAVAGTPGTSRLGRWLRRRPA